MTEEEWLRCEDPREMLEYLRGKTSDRKLRLFAVACCRCVWQRLSEKSSRPAVEVAERYCDQLAEEHDLVSSQQAVESSLDFDGGEPVSDPGFWACSLRIEEDVNSCACYAAGTVTLTLDHMAVDFDSQMEQSIAAEKAQQCKILRDIFGNPFCPVALDPAWPTETAVVLASSIYAERAFDRMPILADALEEAGCDSADILAHCRGRGPHVRGCWVVDLLLGKG